VRVVPLVSADQSCGGKAATLGRLLRAGMPVPPGMVLTGLHPGSVDDPALAAVVTVVLDRLGGGPLAVRSSTTDEDGTAASWAGVLDTVLGVTGAEAVTDAVRACVASSTAPPAHAYRRRLNRPSATATPVLVQSLVAADTAGVLFTRHPVTGADEVVIAAAWGLGTSVVEGSVEPDTVLVGGTEVAVAVGEKATRLDARDGRLERTAVPDGDRRRPCLTTEQARRLGAMGSEVADLLGGPQDVEWAVADGDLWLLQARPVTAASRPDRRRARLTAAAPASARRPLASGVAASPGVATGTVRVLRDPSATMEAGDVLVCATTSPAWTHHLAVASAVVTETGNLLSHAAIVAREFGIPAVVSVTAATTLLVDGSTVTVDGSQGTVEDHSPSPHEPTGSPS
jgi:pyruvate, water dikinase